MLVSQAGFGKKRDVPGLVAEMESDPGGRIAVRRREVIAGRLQEDSASTLIDGTSTDVPDVFEHPDEVLRPYGSTLKVLVTLLQLCHAISQIGLDSVLRFHGGPFRTSGRSLAGGKAIRRPSTAPPPSLRRSSVRHVPTHENHVPSMDDYGLCEINVDMREDAEKHIACLYSLCRKAHRAVGINTEANESRTIGQRWSVS